MKRFEIKVTGSGTKAQITKALKELVKTLETIKDLDQATFEDETLCTELKEDIF